MRRGGIIYLPPPDGGYSLIWPTKVCAVPKATGFSAVLVIKRVSILAILVKNRVKSLLHSSLELSMFLRKSYFHIIIDKTINQSPS